MSALPGLLDASFRRIGFDVPDTSSAPGRRVAEHLFPGVDIAAFDDLGLAPKKISVTGVLLGDDYIAQAKRLEAAFEKPGPGTLVHPWLGVMRVILAEPAEISFSSKELRVARFTATFKHVQSGGSASVSTASLVASAVTGLAASALSLIASPAATAGRIGDDATKRSFRVTAGIWQASPVARYLAAQAQLVPAAPAEFASRIANAHQLVTGAVPFRSAKAPVAPAASAALISGLSPEAALAGFEAIGAGLLNEAVSAPSPYDRAQLAGAAGHALSHAASMTGYVDLPTRTDALDLRGRMSERLVSLGELLSGLSEAAIAGPASEAARATASLRGAIVADLNEAIGRLPALVVVPTTRDSDAWAIAHHLYGDRPETVEAGYHEIVARNRASHPAALPAGRIEAIKTGTARAGTAKTGTGR